MTIIDGIVHTRRSRNTSPATKGRRLSGIRSVAQLAQ
jgi:hypothetical protein